MSDETIAIPQAPDPNVAAEAAAAQLGAEADKESAELAAKITQLPAGVKLATNLDTYEKEKPGAPFWFQHGGGFFHLLDPDDVDFEDVVVVQEHPRLMMHILLDPTQRAAWSDATNGTPLTVGKMKQLVKEYTRHHGLTDLGELTGSARP
jgi:hypothetical protein